MVAAGGINDILATTATLAVAFATFGVVQRNEQRSFGGFGPSSTPTRLDKSSSRAKHALLAENARKTELPTDFGLPNSELVAREARFARGERTKDRAYNLLSTAIQQSSTPSHQPCPEIQ